MSNYDDIVSIAAGYDVALVDLDLITSLSVGGVPFERVLTAGRYNRGEKRITASGMPVRSGYPSMTFVSSFMTLAQYDYLVTTYEGAITAYSWLGSTTPVRYNAVLDMGDVSGYDAVNSIRYGWGLRDVLWSLTRIRIIA